MPESPAAALMEGGLQLGVPLSPHTVARLVLYLQELLRWNAKTNLTGLTTERDLIVKQFLDSLAAFKILSPESALIQPGHGRRLLDVGTGAGFPGLVLKIQDPKLNVTLMEPSQKKAAFLHHMIGLLGLTGITVLIRRLEDVTGEQERCYDLVTTRALRAEVVLGEAPRLLTADGKVLLFRADPLQNLPTGYRLVREESFALPFENLPRTLSLLSLVH